MRYDQYGQAHANCAELVELLYQNPDLNLCSFLVEDPDQFNDAVSALYADTEKLQTYTQQHDLSLDQFDHELQQNWRMPQQYQDLDIAKWLLDQCETHAQLQRVGQELLLFQERDLFNLLKYLKYLVDTIHEHHIVHGVGRGSSVASYALYLLGVHRVDSMYYDLDITEFLK